MAGDPEEYGRRDAFAQLTEELNFQVLDHVFDSFVRTNNLSGRNLSLDEILRCPPYKQYPPYEHLGIPYLSTIFRWISKKDWVNIKLNCNGFLWPLPPSSAYHLPHTRHNTDGWVRMSGAFFDASFPVLSAYFRDCNAALYYARDARRVDIKIWCDDWDVNVIVTYEMGRPYFEDYLDSISSFRVGASRGTR